MEVSSLKIGKTTILHENQLVFLSLRERSEESPPIWSGSLQFRASWHLAERNEYITTIEIDLSTPKV
jgi:hypothetical protein